MGTAVTLKVLQQYLEDFGWTKFTAVDEPYEREGLIFTGYIDEQHRQHEIVIDPIVEKGVLRIFAPRVVMAPREKTPQDRLFELLLALGTLNTVSVLASFAYDPSDGEVKIAVAMPIEENDISFEQFKRALEAVIWGISTYGEGFQEIVDGKAKADDVVKREAAPPVAALAALMGLLHELERRVRSSEGTKADEDEEAEEEDKDTDEE